MLVGGGCGGWRWVWVVVAVGGGGGGRVVVSGGGGGWWCKVIFVSNPSYVMLG